MFTSKAVLFLLAHSFVVVDATNVVKRSATMHLQAGDDKHVEMNEKEHEAKDVKEHDSKEEKNPRMDIFAEYSHMSEDEFNKMAEEETRPLRYSLYALVEEFETKMNEAVEKDPTMKFYQDLYGNQGMDHPDYLAYKAAKKNGTWTDKAASNLGELFGMVAANIPTEDEGEKDELPTKAAEEEKKVESVVKKQPVPDMLNFDARRQASVDALGNIRNHIRSE